MVYECVFNVVTDMPLRLAAFPFRVSVKSVESNPIIASLKLI